MQPALSIIYKDLEILVPLRTYRLRRHTVKKRAFLLGLFALVLSVLACGVPVNSMPVPVTSTLVATAPPTAIPNTLSTVVPKKDIVSVLLANGFSRDASQESYCNNPCRVYTYGNYNTNAAVFNDGEVDIQIGFPSLDVSGFGGDPRGKLLSRVLSAAYSDNVAAQVPDMLVAAAQASNSQEQRVIDSFTVLVEIEQTRNSLRVIVLISPSTNISV